MGTLVVIPARLGAMRLPRKPLRLLSGLPLIVRVWQRISQMNVADAVVVADDGRALYFSRAPIPYLRDRADSAKQAERTLQHIGVYAYTREALREWVSLPPHPLEEIERLEQLRPLAAGLPIGVAATNEAPASGIDTEEDLERANARWDAFMAGAVSNAG